MLKNVQNIFFPSSLSGWDAHLRRRNFHYIGLFLHSWATEHESATVELLKEMDQNEDGILALLKLLMFSFCGGCLGSLPLWFHLFPFLGCLGFDQQKGRPVSGQNGCPWALFFQKLW